MNEQYVQNESYVLMGSSTVIRHVCHLVTKLAESNTPLLIIGEPGTGKDVIAKLIHQNSLLNSAPFLQVKCSAQKEDLLDASIHNSQGTVYFDEVDKLSPKLQEELLKLIKNGISTRNSLESKESPVNMRIICATAVDLDSLTRQGQFREDLLYSLSSTIYLPPLRERKEDIPLLADHFIQKHNQLQGKKITGLSGDALSALLHYTWHNNIQELENLIERVIVFKNGSLIEICDLPPRFRDLITDNIDNFYNEKPLVNLSSFSEKNQKEKMATNDYHSQSAGRNMRTNSTNYESSAKQGTLPNLMKVQGAQTEINKNTYFPSHFNDAPSIIDRFVKKEIDLGSGIDFYKIVEEFENRLIFEALRRTNQNKNRAAQLLSMNRTTLVEKLKKRASSSFIKTDTKRATRNPAFTIFDELGSHHDDNDYTLGEMNDSEQEKESNL